MKLKKKYGFLPDDIIISIVGRFDVIKGQYTLVEAAKLLLASYPNLHFLLVGPKKDLDYIEKIYVMY